MVEKIVEEFPPLFSRSSKGALLEWRISVVDRDGTASIKVVYGQVTGAKQVGYKDILSGKNLGRKNATTPTRQAILDARSVWNKKKDTGYFEEIPEEGFILRLPMLAHDYKKRSHDIRWPAATQPKLEGVRCLARKVSASKMSYMSRQGNEFEFLRHLDPIYLEILSIGEETDGEIFNPEMTFQEIISHLKNPENNGIGLLHYVYDFPSEGARGFLNRFEELEKRFSLLDGVEDCPLVLVETSLVNSESEMLDNHRSYCEQGFEGTIIRNLEGPYVYEHRSANLQKYKDFLEEEFSIVGVEPGSGRDEDIGNFICKCPRTGLLFGAPSTGDRSLRRDYLNNSRKYIGKPLTVRFQRYTESGIPYIPKGIAVRDYE